MITSGNLLEKISEKIAILKQEINQSGILGITNIHKHCENLVKHLLNGTYGYNLINLNAGVSNFPGLDLGDEKIGIAYQVTSDKTSNKVDETLDKVLRHKHYLKFKEIKIFLLSSKQSTYSLNVQTDGYFSFDWKKDVIDFDDLLKDIQDLNANKLEDIFKLLEVELPYTIKKLKGEQESDTFRKATLISINESLAKSNMPYYQHSAIKFRLSGHIFSTAMLYNELSKFYQEGNKRSNLYLFDHNYRKNQTAQQVDFYEKLHSGNVMNYFREGALRISGNSIIVEFASYTTEQLMLTPLNNEVMAILSLLIFFRQLYGNKRFEVELDYDMGSNGKLVYMGNNSQLKVDNYMSSPILNPSPHSFSKVVTDINNDTLNGIFNEIIHGFVTEGEPGYFFPPFLDLNEQAQNPVNDWFKNYFAPSLKDIE
jgi:hypothetical protein